MLVKFSDKVKQSKFLTKKIFAINETEIDSTSPPNQYTIQGTETVFVFIYVWDVLYT